MKAIIRKWAGRRAAGVREGTRRIAILVPLPAATLNADEQVSMRHLRTYLDKYEKFLLVPKGLHVDIPGFAVKEVGRGYYGSALKHNRLLYRIDFWEMFAEFEYVLMYHLDALVFSDQLQEWCDKGLDFIGAPFLRCPDSPWVTAERVGNGGFALYRVPSVLKVLWRRYQEQPWKYLEDHCWPGIALQRKLLRPVRAAMPDWLRGRLTAPLRKQVRKLDHIEINDLGNDSFWADEAKRYLPEFKVASLEDGLRFAFEVCPRMCWQRTGGNMPFGCHAWGRYDRGFWESFLLPGCEYQAGVRAGEVLDD